MTSRALLIAAGAAAMVAAAGQAGQLLRPHPPRPAGADQAVAPPPVLAGAAQAAVGYTRQLLGCPPGPPGRIDRPCGRLIDIDTAVQPATDGAAVMLVTATLQQQQPLRPAGAGPAGRLGPNDPGRLPVTVRLLLTRRDGGWVVVGLR